MPSQEQAVASLLSQLALSFDGAVLGAVLACAAVRSLLRFAKSSAALRKLRNAPSVRVADLRFLLAASPEHPDHSDVPARLLVVRGTVEARGNGFRSKVLFSRDSGEQAVVVQRTQTCIYNEWKGFFGWTSDLRALLSRTWKQEESKSLRTVPFVLVEGSHRPHSDFIVVNMEGSGHDLPLTTVYHQLQPITVSPYTFLQALFGHEYPVGLLDEEKILPVGKNVSAVGLCSFKNGVPEIKSCNDMPYFLSEMTKDQMVVDLALRTKVLLWSGIALGSLSVVILSFAFIRNWSRWKEWRQRRRSRQQNLATNSELDVEISGDEDTGDVPDGQLCVICLMRRRRSAFIPCGHMVCCQSCALTVEREDSPKCPVCRQSVRDSVRIYDS